MMRSRLGVENTGDGEFDVVPARLRRRVPRCWRSTTRTRPSSTWTTPGSPASTTCRGRPGSSHRFRPPQVFLVACYRSRGYSAVGSASRSHREGQGFDSLSSTNKPCSQSRFFAHSAAVWITHGGYAAAPANLTLRPTARSPRPARQPLHRPASVGRHRRPASMLSHAAPTSVALALMFALGVDAPRMRQKPQIVRCDDRNLTVTAPHRQRRPPWLAGRCWRSVPSRRQRTRGRASWSCAAHRRADR